MRLRRACWRTCQKTVAKPSKTLRTNCKRLSKASNYKTGAFTLRRLFLCAVRPLFLFVPCVRPQGLVLLCCCSHRDSKRSRGRKHRMRSALSVWRRMVLPAVRARASLLSLLLSLLTERSHSALRRGSAVFVLIYYLLYYFFIALRSALFSTRTTAFTVWTAIFTRRRG